MAIFIVARVVDVTETPVKNARASVQLAAFSQMTRTSTPGVFELQLPDGTTDVEVFVSLPPTFFPAEQKIKITPTSNPPTARFDGAQHINVRNVAVHTRGADFNVELDVVLGQLRDASTDVATAAASANIDIATTPRSVRRFATPIINAGGTGTGLLNVSTRSVPLPKGVLYAQRTSAPELLAIVNPFDIKTGSDAHRFPLHYNVFFHPAVKFDDDYPFGSTYLSVLSRYVFQTWTAGKSLAYQNLADFPKNVFIFPLGSKAKQLGGIATQDSQLRLLLEVHYWLQRMNGASFPRMRLGGSGITGFSFGASFLASILNSGRNARFHDKVLRMVCVLDGVGSSAKPMLASTLAWHRAGAGNRHLRIYTQFADWLPFAQSVPKATITKAKGGAVEHEADGLSLLFAPQPFWNEISPGVDVNTLHQLFPAWFMEHAITNSGFTPP